MELKTLNCFAKLFGLWIVGRVLNMPLSVYLVRTISSFVSPKTHNVNSTFIRRLEDVVDVT